jgi:hypothetical protein
MITIANSKTTSAAQPPWHKVGLITLTPVSSCLLPPKQELNARYNLAA